MPRIVRIAAVASAAEAKRTLAMPPPRICTLTMFLPLHLHDSKALFRCSSVRFLMLINLSLDRRSDSTLFPSTDTMAQPISGEMFSSAFPLLGLIPWL